MSIYLIHTAVRLKNGKKKAAISGLEKRPGDDLLSQGETPHYHRRVTVSLLSSEWDQVVPVSYGRQEIGARYTLH